MSSTPITTSNVIDPTLLNLLRCPVTKSTLRQDGNFLVSEVGGLKYPVREGIAVMLLEEAVLPEGFVNLDEFKQKFGRS